MWYMRLVRLPKLFFDDHVDRLPEETPVVHKETDRFVWVDPEDPHMGDLEADARHYADPVFGSGRGADTEEGMVRWHHTAKRLLAALEKGYGDA